jgi:O-antigen ligase
MYVRPQDWVPVFLDLPTAYMIIPFALALGFLAYRREKEMFQLPQNKIIPLYLLVIVVSTYINTDSAKALEQLDMFAKRTVVFFMVVWAFTSRERIYGAVWMVLLLSLFLAYQAVLQATTGESWGGMTPYPGYTEIRVRWYGDWDGPNVFGILFVIASAMAMELMFGPHALLMRGLALGLMFSYVTAIYYTNSRGAMLALACSGIFYFVSRFRSVMAILMVGPLVAGLFVFGPSRVDQISSSESSAHERTWLWEQGLQMLKDHPLFGVGRGEFVNQVDLNLIAHNNYVQNFAEMGLSGFFCFISLLWFSFKGNAMLSNPKYAVDPQFSSLGRMMTAVIVGYAVATFFVVMELDLLYFILGLSASVYLVAARQHASLPVLQLTRNDLLIVMGGMFTMIALIWVVAVKEFL